MADVDQESVGDWLVFLVGGERYSLPVNEVEQIIELRESEIQPLPIANKKIRSLVNLRGTILSLVNFPYGTEYERKDKKLRCIIVDYEKKCFAFSSEHVEGVFHQAKGRQLTAAELWNDICKDAETA